ncbi:MAG: guanylate kinase [Chloroflexia bacterium]|nr:guanylate kinase [Chloroflexia bacterium]
MAQKLADVTRADEETEGHDRSASNGLAHGTRGTDFDASFAPLIAEGDEQIAVLRATRKPRVFIVSGPSGVGKDAVIELLHQRHPDAHYVVTATTRPVRPGERDGEDYIFLDEATFLKRLGAGDFLEHAIVYGNHYGVPRGQVIQGLNEGRDVIIKVDVKGAATLRQRISHTISIFLAPESMGELRQRLRFRKTEHLAVLLERFATATHELPRAVEFDYVVFNEAGGLARAVDDLCGIIDSEHHRRHQQDIEVT